MAVNKGWRLVKVMDGCHYGIFLETASGKQLVMEGIFPNDCQVTDNVDMMNAVADILAKRLRKSSLM